MRAEIQNIVSEIENSLELLRSGWDGRPRSTGWRSSTRASRIPNLWDDPAKAQKLMRDRQALVDAMETHDTISATARQYRADRTGRDGRRREVVAEAETALKALPQGGRRRSWRRCWTARPTATTPSSKSTPGPVAPKAATGPRCWRGCMSAGPKSAATRSSCNPKARAMRRGSNRPPTRSAGTTPMAG